ncbi:hypothetical protein L1611_08435 [Alkalihalobacillus sp. EGI L200015]|nr:hypothetical protein [Pseudalkalibacillus salsuginis]
MIVLIYVGSFLIGLSNSSLRIIMNTMLMEIVPKNLMGRALSVWMGIALLLQGVFAIRLGLLIDVFSPSVGFLCMGGLIVVGVAVQFFFTSHKEKRKLKYEVI